ncbi:energy transducer TonB [Methylomonas sp. AM2-LC]|uniref:energy transducer TonB n=1 Tax=Methylomonas sp. AM2-LC TaxID=3153301 RepID=UPI003264E93F
MYQSIIRFPSLSLFLPSALSTPNDGGLPLIATPDSDKYRRPLGILSATLAAALLHGCLLFWYVNRPAPLPFSAAAPLPMIDMMLSAPPSPAVNQPITPPTPVPPKEVKKTDPKPLKKPKPKPKPLPSETKVKQVEVQKDEPDTAPPTSSAPPTENHERAASPRNDTYTPANSDANYLNNPKPVYPMVARQRHWEGLVILRVYITADGHAAQVNVQRSSGHEELDESALEAVKNWRFVPAKRGEFAEASWASVPIDFSLQ